MSKAKRGILRVGTSNIVVPVAKESFPDNFKDKSRLHYYSSIFNTLEINSTFKKIPRLSTFQKWCDDVPEGFQFTIKLSKEITHIKELNGAFQNVESFIIAANHVGNKKGCLLIQFPGKITSEYRKQVEKIISNLYKATGRMNGGRRLSLEVQPGTQKERNFF